MSHKVDMVTGPAAMKEVAVAICYAITQVEEKWDSFTVGWTDRNNRRWTIVGNGDNTVMVSTDSREHVGKQDFGLLLRLQDNTRRELLEALGTYVERVGIAKYFLKVVDEFIQKDEPFNHSLFSSHGEFLGVCHGDEMLHVSCQQPRDEELFSFSIRYNVIDI